MTPEQIENLKKLAEAATPGPWEANNYGTKTTMEWFVDTTEDKADIYRGLGKVADHNDFRSGKREEADMRYIAAASPDVVLALLQERDELLAEVEAFDKAEDSWMRKAIELEAEVERLKKQVIRAADFELDLLRALGGQMTLCGFAEIAEVEKLKADNLDLRSDEALNEAEAEIAKLRGLVAGRSAEYLAAHITYDKGYQEGRLDAIEMCAEEAEKTYDVFLREKPFLATPVDAAVAIRRLK